MAKKTMWTVVLAASALQFAYGDAAGVAPFARFCDGMLSRTVPAGWLRKACETQAAGLTGHQEAMSYPYDSCHWAGVFPRKGEHGEEWWRYEQTAYYVDGLLRLGYALGDAALTAKGERNVDYVLDHASPEGDLGDPCLWPGASTVQSTVPGFERTAGYEMWAMAVFFRAMKAKYDATGDARIPAALAKYYLRYNVEQIAAARNSVSIEGMLWTYGITGDRRLLERAEEAWHIKKDEDYKPGDLSPATCASDRPFFMHGVTCAEELKIPVMLFAYTGRREYLDQAVNAERKIVRDHMLPDGCPSSTEQMRGNNAHWGHESCVISDYTWALGWFLGATGDAAYADRIERCVFNAGFGAVGDDFRTCQYFSNPNQFIATGDSNHNPCLHGLQRMQYRPFHQTECCVGNVQRFLPNYVARMWLSDADGAPVAALYGPSEADYGWAKITEDTRYPFDGKIVFRFSVKEPRESAFTWRVPGWCDAASAKVNGEAVAPGGRGAFATIKRVFRDGDVVELNVPMRTVFETLPPRRYVLRDEITPWTISAAGRDASQGTVVVRGPLIFSYAIPANVTEDKEQYPDEMQDKKSANPDFKSLNMTPAGPFNYALADHSSDTAVAPVDASCWLGGGKPPVTVDVHVRRIDWSLEEGKFTPDVPEKPVPLSDDVETITLVPYGFAKLRLSVFPDLAGCR